MTKLVGFLAILIGSIMVLKALMTPSQRGEEPRPLAKRFMTPRELAMLDILERCLPEYRFHAQVAMGAVLKAPQRRNGRNYPSDRNAFSQKIIDFVAQDRDSGAVVALIEVDDASHNADRDRRRDEMTTNAGYRTIRIAGSVQPNINEVRLAVAPLFRPSTDQSL